MFGEENMATPESMMTPQEYLEHLQTQQFGGEVPPYTRDIGDVLTANLIAGLPDDQRALLRDIAIGVLPTTDVNAYVATVPAGGKVIGFNYGLLSFMLALNKVMLSRSNLLGFEPALEFDQAFELAREIAASFQGSNELPRVTVSPTKMIVASSLSNVQATFVVGHELGHALFGTFGRYDVPRVEHA